jgi:hypothetical protein
MSKATLYDVFEAALKTTSLISGDIAKYRIEQDEAELRKFELEQKKKMADFELNLQADSNFDKYNEKYNTFMDEQQKDLMSRIKTNYGKQKATEWFDSVRTNGQIQVDQIETKLRKNHIIQMNMDTIKEYQTVYQGQELYNKCKGAYDSLYQEQNINESQYHDLMDNLALDVVNQRINSIVDQAGDNCQTLDQMKKYVEDNLSFSDFNFRIYNPTGKGFDIDNTGALSLPAYKEKAKELATQLYNTKKKELQKVNYEYIERELGDIYPLLNTDLTKAKEKIVQAQQYLSDNKNNFEASQYESQSKKLNSLYEDLNKGDIKSAGTTITIEKLAQDLKANDIANYIADFQRGKANGYDIRNYVVNEFFEKLGTGDKAKWVEDNYSLCDKVIDLLGNNLPEKAQGVVKQAESLASKLPKEMKDQAAFIKKDLASFAVDVCLETKWDDNVNVQDVLNRVNQRYNALLLKTSEQLAKTEIVNNKDVINEKKFAQMLKLTTGDNAEEFVFTDTRGVENWLPGGKQAIQKEGGIQDAGTTLLSRITGVDAGNIKPSFKVTENGLDVTSEIQYKIGKDTYELKPTDNNKVDLYINGKYKGNAFKFKENELKAKREELTKEATNAKENFAEETNKTIDSFKEMPFDKGLLGVKDIDWKYYTEDQKKQILRDLKMNQPEKFDKYIEKYKTQLGLQ